MTRKRGNRQWAIGNSEGLGAGPAPYCLLPIAYCLLPIAFLASGCAGTAPAPSLITVTPEPVRPPIASECYAPGPADPVLAATGEAGAATALDVVRHIEARKAQVRTLVRLRAVCRSALVASFGDPAPEKPVASRSVRVAKER